MSAHIPRGHTEKYKDIPPILSTLPIFHPARMLPGTLLSVLSIALLLGVGAWLGRPRPTRDMLLWEMPPVYLILLATVLSAIVTLSCWRRPGQFVARFWPLFLTLICLGSLPASFILDAWLANTLAFAEVAACVPMLFRLRTVHPDQNLRWLGPIAVVTSLLLVLPSTAWLEYHTSVYAEQQVMDTVQTLKQLTGLVAKLDNINWSGMPSAAKKGNIKLKELETLETQIATLTDQHFGLQTNLQRAWLLDQRGGDHPLIPQIQSAWKDLCTQWKSHLDGQAEAYQDGKGSSHPSFFFGVPPLSYDPDDGWTRMEKTVEIPNALRHYQDGVDALLQQISTFPTADQPLTSTGDVTSIVEEMNQQWEDVQEAWTTRSEKLAEVLANHWLAEPSGSGCDLSQVVPLSIQNGNPVNFANLTSLFSLSVEDMSTLQGAQSGCVFLPPYHRQGNPWIRRLDCPVWAPSNPPEVCMVARLVFTDPYNNFPLHSTPKEAYMLLPMPNTTRPDQTETKQFLETKMTEINTALLSQPGVRTQPIDGDRGDFSKGIRLTAPEYMELFPSPSLIGIQNAKGTVERWAIEITIKP